jgi:hypothetical protein
MSAMSGAISIPFGIIALYSDGHNAKTLFAALAFISLLVFAISIIAKNLALQESMRRKFKISCHPSISACRVKTHFSSWIQDAVFYRLIVEADCQEPIPACTGYLTKVEKDGKLLMGHENIQLTFSPGDQEDAIYKTLSPKIPAYLDVLLIIQMGQIVFCSKGYTIPNSLKPSRIFEAHGDYILTISVTGTSSQTTPAKIRFNWNGNWETSEMELISIY